MKIVEAEPRDVYRLWIRFEDGVEGEMDLSDLAGAPLGWSASR